MDMVLLLLDLVVGWMLGGVIGTAAEGDPYPPPPK